MRTLKALNQNNLLFYDIETARVVKDLEPDTPLYNSWDYKVNKDGKLTQDEVIASFSYEAGLYPEFAKVVSIVVGKIVDNKIHLVTLDHDDEKDILEGFNNLLERNIKCNLVGFVNIGFDSPFVFKRMLINGIQPHDKIDSSGLKPWEMTEVDLGKEWQCTSFARASLINIATAFGLPSPKDDISGADVGNVYWNEGRKGLDRISVYCRKDVVTTINIFRKMRLEEPLELAGGVEEVEEEKPLTLPESLFNGGAYGAKEKKMLLEHLKTLNPEELESAWLVLDSLTSTASGKKTKITKTHIKALKEEIKNE